MDWSLNHVRVGVIGLGYVGLPLAAALSRNFEVIGFDIDSERVSELVSGHDRTRELSTKELSDAGELQFTTDVGALQRANVYIVTTPTPIDAHKRPDMSAVLSASRTVGSVMSAGDLVVYESTVYPGATEEECVPILESVSGLKFNRDFFVGYSPERINPGDKEHRFETICKVTSGSTPEAAIYVDEIYSSVVTAGTYSAPSIRVAEAAKVIENTQRDVNIALINELALIFDKLGIDTDDVLRAAGTKWNFLNFRPGLVGGHCIGVDPYYLTHKAQEAGYHPEIVLAGRRINDSMGEYVATRLVREMMRRNIDMRAARVLVLGLTFKENTPDLRNSRVVDIVDELIRFGVEVDVHDPWADTIEAINLYGIGLVGNPKRRSYDAIVLAVAHDDFKRLGVEGVHTFGRHDACVVYDLKSVLPREVAHLRL